jgi:extradiol dioxygenase family protein
MLAKHPIDVMLPAPDLGAAKQFYGDKIGPDVLLESDEFVTFGCGGDSRLVVTRTTTPSTGHQTKASGRVVDVAAEVASRCGRVNRSARRDRWRIAGAPNRASTAS